MRGYEERKSNEDEKNSSKKGIIDKIKLLFQ